jgi:desulfoferrodoxin (superoxide reductase-like protein)
MKFKKETRLLFFVVFMVIAFLTAGLAYADKSAVRIEAPTQAKVGETITITLHVSHQGNNLFHHTDRVTVRINGEEVKRWEYGMFSTPDAENFTLTVPHTVTGPIVIEAEANCNIHGSTGVTKHSVAVP